MEAEPLSPLKKGGECNIFSINSLVIYKQICCENYKYFNEN